MDLKLDWLAFTFKPERDVDTRKLHNTWVSKNALKMRQELRAELESMSDIDLFFETFPEFDAIKSDMCIISGYSHYENVLGFMGICDTCRICYNSEGYTDVDMGVNVSIPSHGLEWFFELMGFDIADPNSVSELFQELKNRGCHCSRIDLAFDDYSKTFRPKNYIAWFYSGNLRTRFRKITTAGSLREVGHTFYLGDRKKKMLRVYDKDVESKGEIDAVRYEFELHQHHSRDMFEYLIEHKTINFIEFIRTYFEVIDLDSATWRGDCKLLPAWEAWLHNLDFSEELPQRVDIPSYTLDQRQTDTFRWFYQSCARSIKGFVACFGWQTLMDKIRTDDRDIPDKYRVFVEHLEKEKMDAEYHSYSFDYGDFDNITYENIGTEDVPKWVRIYS